MAPILIPIEQVENWLNDWKKEDYHARTPLNKAAINTFIGALAGIGFTEDMTDYPVLIGLEDNTHVKYSNHTKWIPGTYDIPDEPADCDVTISWYGYDITHYASNDIINELKRQYYAGSKASHGW